MDGAPLNYLTAAGFRASQIAWLTWGLMAVSVLVIAVIAGLLLAGIGRRPASSVSLQLPPATRPGPALEWIYVGVGASAVVLFASAVWTMYTLAAVGSAPPQDAALTIAITGHQWWWEAQYLSDKPALLLHGGGRRYYRDRCATEQTLSSTSSRPSSGHSPSSQLLGHSKIESTVRYLGIEVDDAIEIAEKIDI